MNSNYFAIDAILLVKENVGFVAAIIFLNGITTDFVGVKSLYPNIIFSYHCILTNYNYYKCILSK